MQYNRDKLIKLANEVCKICDSIEKLPTEFNSELSLKVGRKIESLEREFVNIGWDDYKNESCIDPGEVFASTFRNTWAKKHNSVVREHRRRFI